MNAEPVCLEACTAVSLSDVNCLRWRVKIGDSTGTVGRVTDCVFPELITVSYCLPCIDYDILVSGTNMKLSAYDEHGEKLDILDGLYSL